MNCLCFYLFVWVSACLRVVDHFVGPALKRLIPVLFDHHQTVIYLMDKLLFLFLLLSNLMYNFEISLTSTVSVYVLMAAGLDASATDVCDCDLSVSSTQHNLESRITHLDICPCVFLYLEDYVLSFLHCYTMIDILFVPYSVSRTV